MSIKFLVLGGGGEFWVLGGGGGKCRFYFYGRADFSERTPGRFTARPLPVQFTTKMSVVGPFSVLSTP